jgi:hypothetical protein
MVCVTVRLGKNNGLEPGTLTLLATTEGVGENVSTIYAAVDGPEQHIIFNAEYLSEYLTVTRRIRSQVKASCSKSYRDSRTLMRSGE